MTADPRGVGAVRALVDVDTAGVGHSRVRARAGRLDPIQVEVDLDTVLVCEQGHVAGDHHRARVARVAPQTCVHCDLCSPSHQMSGLSSFHKIWKGIHGKGYEGY